MYTKPQPLSIRPQRERIEWIERRVREHRLEGFPEQPGWALGTPARHVSRLVDYWLEEFSFEQWEATLNQFDHYRCQVEGTPIHFLHARPTGPSNGQALVLLHGWPGSVFEFYGALKELLSDPSWPFDVIVPSLPGFAFSTPLQEPTGCRRIAALIDTLVTEHLGFDSYVAQGGDWGAVVASWLGFDHGDACRAIHLNSEGVRVHGAPQYEPILEGDWSDEERRHFALEQGELGSELGYYVQQSTRPQTLGHAMRNDPVGAAAWISEKFHGWSNLSDEEDPGDYFGWDRLLTNTLLYIVPDAFVTATWIYAGHELHDPKTLPPGTRIEVPTGFVSCADPIVPPPPRSMIERAHNLVWWQEDDGGHFAAFEKPQAFAAGLRDFLDEVS